MVPAADGGASAEAPDTASAASMAAAEAATSKRVRVFVRVVIVGSSLHGNEFLLLARVRTEQQEQFETAITIEP